MLGWFPGVWFLAVVAQGRLLLIKTIFFSIQLEDGIYLDELDDNKPELMSLYFPQQ